VSLCKRWLLSIRTPLIRHSEAAVRVAAHTALGALLVSLAILFWHFKTPLKTWTFQSRS
jgi:hypothetical protein